MGFSEKEFQLISIVATFINIPLGIYRYAISWYISFSLMIFNAKIYWDGGDYVQCIARFPGLLGNLYGAYKWSSVKKEAFQPITKTSRKTWMILVPSAFFIALFFYITLSILYRLEILSWSEKYPRPLVSSSLAAFMLVGQWLTAHKKLESQYFWSVYNLLAASYYGLEAKNWFWVKHVIYFPLCFYGIHKWYQQYEKEQDKREKKDRIV